MEQTEQLFLGNDFDPNSDLPINFLETRLNDLSPFSAHEILIDGIVFKTAEHAYQALRVVPEARTAIIAAKSPMDAWRLGQVCKAEGKLLPAQDKEQLMELIFKAKLAQHTDIENVLIATKNRQLLKVYDADSYWGTGADGSGENKMGKLWMKLRDEISAEK